MPGYYKKASALPISVIQRAILEELVQRHTSQQCHVKRAGIILLSSEGRSMTEVTEQLRMSTVGQSLLGASGGLVTKNTSP